MSTKKRIENRNPGGSSLYPLHPVSSLEGGNRDVDNDGDNDAVRIVFRIPVQDDLTLWDRCVVAGTSLGVVGAFAWVPLLYLYGAWRLYKSIPSLSSSSSGADDDDDDADEQQRQSVQRHKRRRAMIVASIVAATVALLTTHGPHRSPRFGRWLRIRHWKMWMSWLKFIAMEVIVDQTPSDTMKAAAHSHEPTQRLLVLQQPDEQEQQAMLAFVPHGIFPFAFAFGALPVLAQRAFGIFRPVVATATNFFPVVSDFLLWLHKIDASKPAVEQALAQGDRIGIVPGGIAEIFEGYPKRGAHVDEEYAIVRQGFLRLALRHHVPVVPIYCFGATKMFRRWNVPILERLSTLWRASIVIFYGVCGLPIPFRQKLLYVIGNTIDPKTLYTGNANADEQSMVDAMHKQFCSELVRIFERHKEAYGWGHKSLKLITK